MSMNNLTKAAGGIAAVIIALFGWGYKMTEKTAVQEQRISVLEQSVQRLADQYDRYDAQMAALIHKQDVRITLLERLLEYELDREVVKDGN